MTSNNEVNPQYRHQNPYQSGSMSLPNRSYITPTGGHFITPAGGHSRRPSQPAFTSITPINRVQSTPTNASMSSSSHVYLISPSSSSQHLNRERAVIRTSHNSTSDRCNSVAAVAIAIMGLVLIALQISTAVTILGTLICVTGLYYATADDSPAMRREKTGYR